MRKQLLLLALLSATSLAVFHGEEAQAACTTQPSVFSTSVGMVNATSSDTAQSSVFSLSDRDGMVNAASTNTDTVTIQQAPCCCMQCKVDSNGMLYDCWFIVCPG